MKPEFIEAARIVALAWKNNGVDAGKAAYIKWVEKSGIQPKWVFMAFVDTVNAILNGKPISKVVEYVDINIPYTG